MSHQRGKVADEKEKKGASRIQKIIPLRVVFRKAIFFFFFFFFPFHVLRIPSSDISHGIKSIIVDKDYSFVCGCCKSFKNNDILSLCRTFCLRMLSDTGIVLKIQ